MSGPAIYPRGDLVGLFADLWPPPGSGDDDEDDGMNEASTNHGAKSGSVSSAHRESRKSDHGGTWSLTANFVLTVPVEPVFMLEPYVGFGASYIVEGDQEGSNYALKSDVIFPTFSYGLGVTAHIGKKTDLIVRYRSLVFYTNKVKFEGPDGPIIRDDYDKIDASMLLIGLGIRL